MFHDLKDELLRMRKDAEPNGPNGRILWPPITMEHLKDLVHAYDIAVISTKARHMQSKLIDWQNYAELHQLRMITQQTKLMRLNILNPEHFQIGGQQIEEVQKFTYVSRQPNHTCWWGESWWGKAKSAGEHCGKYGVTKTLKCNKNSNLWRQCEICDAIRGRNLACICGIDQETASIYQLLLTPYMVHMIATQLDIKCWAMPTI